MKLYLLAAAVAVFALVGSAHAEADLKKGAKVFKKCKACHSVGEKAKNKIGPQLNGIADRPAGSSPDFKYSKAMLAKAEEGLKWDDESLTGYLKSPKKFLGGPSKMTLKLKKADQIENVIAYLKTFNADGTAAE
jgi:cytochrome c